MKIYLGIVGCFFLTCGIGEANDLAERIPITMQNLQGHKSLYNEGWFVVSSTKDALNYAFDKSYTSSAQVWQQVNESLKSEKLAYQNKKTAEAKETAEEVSRIEADMSRNTTEVDTDFVASRKKLKETSKEHMKQAYQQFVLGYVELKERTAEDVKELKALPGNYFHGLDKDFSNFYSLIGDLDKKTENQWRDSWHKSFLVGNEEFEREYKESGTQTNSILALWSLGKGYCKALYYSFLKPSAATTLGALGVGFHFTERFVLNTGKSFFYVSSIGYKMISPTVEGGLLSAIALASWSSEKVLHGTQGAVYAFNQVAVASSEPVYKSGRWLVSTTANTADYAVTNTFNVVSGASEIAVNQVKAGVVLGYNALTALPTQTLLACANSVVFLAYDGPRLAIYSLKGEVDGVPVQELPVGTVIDQKKAESLNLKIEKVSEDPQEIQSVIEKSKDDL